MDWVTGMQRAIDYIEDNLSADLDFTEIAKRAYVSSFHFQRVFSILCGYTVGEYIRNRRLTLAATELQKGEFKVIDIALRYGYDTPESFSRAFTRFHGVTPSASKELGANLKSCSRLSIKVILEGGTVMDYKIVQKNAFRLITKYVNVNVTENPTFTIPGFWDRCIADGTFNELREYAASDDLLHKAVVGIADATSFDGTCYKYFIGSKYDRESAPVEYAIKEIPDCTWAIFRCVGMNKQSIISETFKRIYSEFFPTSEYKPAELFQLEVYPEGDISHRDYVSEIWISVEKK